MIRHVKSHSVGANAGIGGGTILLVGALEQTIFCRTSRKAPGGVDELIFELPSSIYLHDLKSALRTVPHQFTLDLSDWDLIRVAGGESL